MVHVATATSVYAPPVPCPFALHGQCPAFTGSGRRWREPCPARAGLAPTRGPGLRLARIGPGSRPQQRHNLSESFRVVY